MTQMTLTTVDPNRTCAETASVSEIAQQRLRQSPYSALRHVQCRFHQGVLTLTGDVPTFYTKQIAQALVRNLDEVKQIDNRLNVTF